MNVSPWVLQPAECQQNEAQFILLQPVNGLIDGDHARPFFLKSGLPPNVLAQIWQLADLNKDGRLDRLEFSIAMRLVRNCLSGLPLPPVLPESMKRLLPPSVPTTPVMMPQPPQPPRPMTAYGGPLPANYGSVGAAPLYSKPKAQPTMATAPAFVMGVKELGDWSIPQHLKLRFSQLFNQLDKSRVGLLTGAQARGTLGESQLPTNLLAQIWGMADVNKSGCLSIEQFCVAMFLIEMMKSGYALPSTLPHELSTFCHRSKTTSPLGDPTAPPPQKNAPLKTFEDKRRDNLDRGQAELERRRQILREEEERRRAEVERKEREEEERRERERQELEKRREAEREAERQREMARERQRAAEEERIKQEREEARRRLDQERIKELEKIRIRDLETQHQNELEKTTQCKQRHKTMTFQLQAMEERSQQLIGEIAESRDQIIAITGEIEGMRVSRDQKLARINELSTKSQQLAVQCERIGHEHLQLRSECRRTLGRTQEIETLRRDIADRRAAIAANEQELANVKERLVSLERQVAEKTPELENHKEKLKIAVDTYNQLVNKLCAAKEAAQRRAAAKQAAAPSQSELYALPPDASTAAPPAVPNVLAADFDAAFDAAPVNSDVDFVANFDAAFPNTTDSSTSVFNSAPLYAVPPDTAGVASTQTTPAAARAVNGNGAHKIGSPSSSGSSSATTVRYRALFEFVARSEDELSIQPGDTILVFENHASEPGWLAGQIRDKVGWFPASFAERISPTPTSAAVLKTQNSTSVPTSPSAEPLESIKEEPPAELVADFKALKTVDSPTGNGVLSAPKTNGVNGDGAGVAALYDAPPGDVPAKATGPVANSANEPVLAVGVALYQWKARNDTDLSFNRNDVIEILEQGEMRWRGRLQKKLEQQGWFPKSYVKLSADKAGSDDGGRSQKDASAVNEKISSSADKTAVKPSVQSPTASPVDKIGEPSKKDETLAADNVYIAMYQFDAVEPTDLSLKPGDTIHVLESTDDWWKGTCDGRTGIFPANYVQKVSLLRPQGSWLYEHSVGKALAAFEATGPNQISLQAGDFVHIHSMSPGGWWEGEVTHDGVTASGWFPGNYIQLMYKFIEKNTRQMIEDEEDGNAAAPKAGALADALFDYDAQHADELSFKAGDALEVLDTTAGQWWKGRRHPPVDANAPALLFPANFVQLRR